MLCEPQRVSAQHLQGGPKVQLGIEVGIGAGYRLACEKGHLLNAAEHITEDVHVI